MTLSESELLFILTFLFHFLLNSETSTRKLDCPGSVEENAAFRNIKSKYLLKLLSTPVKILR